LRIVRALLVFVSVLCVLASCVPVPENVDPELSLPDAKEYTQTIEREISEALPAQMLLTMKQKETGTFLSCSRDGGYQWAGGLTAQMQRGVEAEAVLDPVEQNVSRFDDLTVTRREDEEDSIVDVVGPHHSAWVVRYDRENGEVYVTSFSPCIRLPEDVWPGDKY
jgi:hypothetical protein